MYAIFHRDKLILRKTLQACEFEHSRRAFMPRHQWKRLHGVVVVYASSHCGTQQDKCHVTHSAFESDL